MCVTVKTPTKVSTDVVNGKMAMYVTTCVTVKMPDKARVPDHRF